MGQSITLTHLAPFVDVSRQNIRKEVHDELKDVHFDTEEEKQTLIENIVHSRLQKEINKGVQTIQYQVVTLMTTNGW